MIDETPTLEESEGIIYMEGVEDAIEPQLIDAGDYRAEITKAELQKSKNNEPMIRVVFKIHDTGLANPNLVVEYFMLITANDDDEKRNNKNVRLKRFFRCFGYQLEKGKLDLKKIDGLLGEVTLGVDPAKDGFDASNRVRKWNEPRF